MGWRITSSLVIFYSLVCCPITNAGLRDWFIQCFRKAYHPTAKTPAPAQLQDYVKEVVRRLDTEDPERMRLRPVFEVWTTEGRAAFKIVNSPPFPEDPLSLIGKQDMQNHFATKKRAPRFMRVMTAEELSVLADQFPSLRPHIGKYKQAVVLEYIPDHWDTKSEAVPSFIRELDQENIIRQMQELTTELTQLNIYAEDLQFLITSEDWVYLSDFDMYHYVSPGNRSLLYNESYLASQIANVRKAFATGSQKQP